MSKPKVFYVSVSDFGSIGEVNPWNPREETLFKYWCKNNKHIAKRFLQQNGYVITDDEAVVAEEISKVEKEFTVIIGQKRPTSSDEVAEIMKSYSKKIKEAAVKDKLPEQKLENLKKNMISTLNKACGTNSEKEILDKTEVKSGKTISSRNDKMYYKNIHEDQEFIFKIGGKVDGISDDIIIEAKNRMTLRTVRKNVYDLYQLFGYMFLTDKKEGKIVQKCNNENYDSDVETGKEWGLVCLDNRWDKFLSDYLLTFFEELKNVPENVEFLRKPFITRKKGNYLISAGHTRIEDEIYKILYELDLYQISDDDLMESLIFYDCESVSKSEENPGQEV